MVSFNEIIGCKDNEVRMSRREEIDRNGRFYHATQRVSNKEFVFDKELGQCRHNMLCSICSQYNVKIIFSVTMSNHTHDVLVAEKWRDVVDALRLVNTAVSHRLRRKFPTKYRNGRTVFESGPHYRAIKDIVELTTVGKYDYDNVKSVLNKGEFVPYDCFWFLERGLMCKSYDKDIYPLLFGMTENELCVLRRQ